MAYVNSVPCSRSTDNTGGGFAGMGRCGMRGLGCAMCGGKCGQAGLGIFDSGLDFSQWGIGEWAAVGLGAYVVLSLAGDTRSAASSVSIYRKRRRRAKAIAAQI